MVANSQSSKRKRGAASKRGKRQRLSVGASLSTPTTADEESNSSNEIKNNEAQRTIGINVDPDLLGPCEPGSEVILEGIVWTETNKGALAVNVTWKGRTYVGTLLDSSADNYNLHRPTKLNSEESLACSDNTKNKICVKSESAETSIKEEEIPINLTSDREIPFKLKSSISQNCDSSNPIQELEFMTSNHISSFQTIKPSSRFCHIPPSTIPSDQSPINALSSLIEGTTSHSFDIDSRCQQMGRKQPVCWSRPNQSGWASKLCCVNASSIPSAEQKLKQRDISSVIGRFVPDPCISDKASTFEKHTPSQYSG